MSGLELGSLADHVKACIAFVLILLVYVPGPR